MTPTTDTVRLVKVTTDDGSVAYCTEDKRFIVTRNDQRGSYGYHYHVQDMQRFTARANRFGGGYVAETVEYPANTLAECKRWIARQIEEPGGGADAGEVVRERVEAERDASRKHAAARRAQTRRLRALERAAAVPIVRQRMQALVERSDAEIEALQRALHLARRRRERAADVMRIHNGDTNLRGDTYARS